MIDTAKYGPWALVAGGSEGVGAEFAQLLAEAGLNLVLVARKPDPLQHTAERCRQHGGEVRTVQADLSAPDACESIAAATSGLEVGLLILVAGANTHSHGFLDGDLAGEGCRYLTGNTLFVDGGSHINGVAWTPDLDAAP